MMSLPSSDTTTSGDAQSRLSLEHCRVLHAESHTPSPSLPTVHLHTHTDGQVSPRVAVVQAPTALHAPRWERWCPIQGTHSTRDEAEAAIRAQAVERGPVHTDGQWYSPAVVGIRWNLCERGRETVTDAIDTLVARTRAEYRHVALSRSCGHAPSS